MNNHKLKLGVSALALATALPLAQTTQAFDVSVSGFIRQEMAYKLDGGENRFNRSGSYENGREHAADGAFGPLLGYNDGTASALVPSTTKQDKGQNNNWTVFATRAEVDTQFTFTDKVTGFMKVRGYYQPDVFGDWKGFDPEDHIYDRDGNSTRDRDEFGVDNHGSEATYLSVSDNDYMIDIPSLYIDYVDGPLWLRIGQQQIAWGEGLFFRTADQPNGLDVRRHFFLDYGSEEYADERLGAPAIRGSYNLNSDWEIEVYAQMFQPSVLMGTGTSYNLIAQPNLSPDYQEGFDRVDDQVNVGARLRGQIGNLGVQLFAIAQHSNTPVWDLKAGGQKIYSDAECNTAGSIAQASGLCGFENQPFVFVDGGDGTTSSHEWFYVSAISGIDGADVVNGLIEDWPWIEAFAAGLGMDTSQDVITTIDGGGPNDFFGMIPDGINGNDFVELFPAFAAINGGITGENYTSTTGTIMAHYESENVFGGGFNYIFFAEPDSWLDQLIVRFEASYVPNKSFTNGLRHRWIEEDEILTTFVVEKYHRFSNDFPATYLVFQWHHRKESDLLGRHLSGLGGSSSKRPGGLGGTQNDRGWDGLVFAFSQPSPALKWRFDTAFLYDTEGGFLLQPGVKWKPNGSFTVEAFINIIEGTGTDDVFDLYDQSDDLTFRVGYQF